MNDNRRDSMSVIKNRDEKKLESKRKEDNELTNSSSSLLQERARQISALGDVLTERTIQCSRLQKEITERNQQLLHVSTQAAQFSIRLEQLKNSFGWKCLAPLRAISNLRTRVSGKYPVKLFPFHGVRYVSGDCEILGSDPQLLLLSQWGWRRLAGWYWLDIHTEAEHPLKINVCYDLGRGFQPSLKASFQLFGNGRQRLAFYVPISCAAIRVDLAEAPLMLGLSVLALVKVKSRLAMNNQGRGLARLCHALAGFTGNIAALNPGNEIEYIEDSDLVWHSFGEDPWLLLEGVSPKLKSGWCMIEMRIESNLAQANAKLYFDVGADFNEADSVDLPFRNDQLVKRYFYLPKAVKQIRLDPCDCSAYFSVKHFNIINVSEKDAYDGMLERIDSQSSVADDFKDGGIWERVAEESTRSQKSKEEILKKLYARTFPLVGMSDAVSYADWIARFEHPAKLDSETLGELQCTFDVSPMISVIMPVYNTPEHYLRRAIESVVEQSYRHWELCIADDASDEPHVQKIIAEYAELDSRIKVALRSENGHISAASNSALELATGDYVALLDHDDELAVDALHFIVDTINKNPLAAVVYTDEDKIDEVGERFDPHFKSDWNPDLFFSQNYVSHLGVYGRALIEKVGGFRVGVEGSQDHDLLLRCLPFIEASQIIHVPRVLYHWRVAEGSTALSAHGKGYTESAAIAALDSYFKSQHQENIMIEKGQVANTYRVKYLLQSPLPLTSLLIPTKDRTDLLKPCIQSILDKTSYPNFEILILDNGSVESETKEYFNSIQQADDRVKVLPYDLPFNYSAINNFGVRNASGEIIGLVNNDIEVINSDWLTEMVSHAMRPEIGCVGAKLYYEDDTIQHAGVILGLGGVAGHSHKNYPRQKSGFFHRLKVVQNLSAVTAACMVVRKEVYLEVGGLDEEYLKIAFNDVDFCLKVREAGYRNLWTPYAELYHYESKSRGLEDTPEKVERFNMEAAYIKDKWKESLINDPYYNPNLTLAREDFSLC